MSAKTYLTPEQQLDKTLGYAIDTDHGHYGTEYLMLGVLVRNTKWFRSGDFVVFHYSNGGAERWKSTGVSSKGRRVHDAYLHFQKWYPDHRQRTNRGRMKLETHRKTICRDADVVAVNDRSGQPIKFLDLIERWSVDPTVQREIVESLRAGTVVRR